MFIFVLSWYVLTRIVTFQIFKNLLLHMHFDQNGDISFS